MHESVSVSAAKDERNRLQNCLPGFGGSCTVKYLPPFSLAGASSRSLPYCADRLDNRAKRHKRVVPSTRNAGVKKRARVQKQACLPRRPLDAIVEEEFVIEAQDQVLARAPGIRQHVSTPGTEPVLLRNSRLLIFLSLLGSLAALFVALGMIAVALTAFFPLRALTADRFAAGMLWAIGAWLMAMSQVYLWRQGNVMSNCSILLDNHGAHFRFGDQKNATEAFVRWNEIAAVQYKRISNAKKFTILSKDTNIVTFTSHSFYRPRRVARLIAQRAGLPLQRG